MQDLPPGMPGLSADVGDGKFALASLDASGQSGSTGVSLAPGLSAEVGEGMFAYLSLDASGHSGSGFGSAAPGFSADVGDGKFALRSLDASGQGRDGSPARTHANPVMSSLASLTHSVHTRMGHASHTHTPCSMQTSYVHRLYEPRMWMARVSWVHGLRMQRILHSHACGLGCIHDTHVIYG